MKEAGTVVQPLSRRDRVRAATVTEIKDTARRILVGEGIDGLSLRAIAREMGMTAPALYRYFPSREDLLVHLIGDLYDELSDTMEAARDAEDPAGHAQPAGRGQPRLPALGPRAPARVRAAVRQPHPGRRRGRVRPGAQAEPGARGRACASAGPSASWSPGST